MDRKKIDRWLELGILGLALGILIIGPLFNGLVRIQDFVVVQFGVIAMLGLWILRLWVAEKPQFWFPPLSWAALAFVAYGFFSYGRADVEYVAREELMRVVLYAIILIVISNNLSHPDLIKAIALTLVFLGMGIAMYGLYQALTGSNKVWFYDRSLGYAGRGSGTYICPNHMTGFLEMILPIGLGLVLMGRIKSITKVFLGYAALAIVVGIGVSVSRGGWVATALALGVMFGVLLQYREYRVPALAFFAILALAVTVYVVRSDLSQRRFSTLFAGEQFEDARFRIWPSAVQVWQDDPWLGVGPAQFDSRFAKYRTPGVQQRPVRVHNDYLNTLADWGIAGTALVVAAWACLYAGVFFTWRKLLASGNARDAAGRRSNRVAFLLGGSIGLLALLVHSFVDFNMHIPANAITAVTIMALLSGLWRFATGRFNFNAHWAVKLGVTAAAVCAIVWLSRHGTTRFHEAELLDTADGVRQRSLADYLAVQKAAHTIEPTNFETPYRIGEIYRLMSFQGLPGYETMAAEAIKWFEIAAKLNPHNPYVPVRHGMCLDWLDKPQEAKPYFDLAYTLDPNGFFVLAHMGWHEVQVDNYTAAKEWLGKSLAVKTKGNPLAVQYMNIVRERLEEEAKRQRP